MNNDRIRIDLVESDFGFMEEYLNIALDTAKLNHLPFGKHTVTLARVDLFELPSVNQVRKFEFEFTFFVEGADHEFKCHAPFGVPSSKVSAKAVQEILDKNRQKLKTLKALYVQVNALPGLYHNLTMKDVAELAAKCPAPIECVIYNGVFDRGTFRCCTFNKSFMNQIIEAYESKTAGQEAEAINEAIAWEVEMNFNK